jgi:uncharacterized protein YaaQ
LRLVFAVVQPEDLAALLRNLAAAGFEATQIEGDGATAGGGLSAVILAVDDDQIYDTVAAVRASTQRRTQRGSPLRPIGELAEFWIPGAVERSVGGASVYIVPIKRFERIGYA